MSNNLLQKWHQTQQEQLILAQDEAHLAGTEMPEQTGIGA